MQIPRVTGEAIYKQKMFFYYVPSIHIFPSRFFTMAMDFVDSLEKIKVWALRIKSFNFITQFFFNGFFIFLLHSQYLDLHVLSDHIQLQISNHENKFQADVPKHKIVLPCFLFQMLPWLGEDCFILLLQNYCLTYLYLTFSIR